MISLFLIFVLVALGFASMFVSTISGGGTNVVLVPVLVVAFRFTPSDAIGTAFTALAAGSLAAAIRFSHEGKVNYKWGIILGAASVPGVVIGSLVTSLIQDIVFKVLLGIIIMSLAVLMTTRSVAGASHERYEENKGPDMTRSRLGVISVLLIGFFVGTFGAGGGLLLMPVLQFMGFPILVTLGTMRIVGLLIGISAFATRTALAQVDAEFAAALCVGMILGGTLGAKMTLGMKPDQSRRLAAMVIFALGAILLFEAL